MVIRTIMLACMHARMTISWKLKPLAIAIIAHSRATPMESATLPSSNQRMLRLMSSAMAHTLGLLGAAPRQYMKPLLGVPMLSYWVNSVTSACGHAGMCAEGSQRARKWWERCVQQCVSGQHPSPLPSHRGRLE